MVAPVAAAVGGAAAGGVKAASMGSVAPSRMTQNFGNSGMKMGLNSLGSTDITSVLLNIEKEEKKRNSFSSMSLAKLISIGGMLQILESGTPFKGVVSLLKSIIQIFLVPIGMMLLTLLKPFLILGIKVAMDFMKWIMNNQGLMQVIQGLGEIILGIGQMIVGAFGGIIVAPLLGALGLIVFGIGYLVEAFTGFSGIKELGSGILQTTSDAIEGAANLFIEGIVNVTGGFIRLSVATMGGADALEIIRTMNTQEIVDVLGSVKAPAEVLATDLGTLNTKVVEAGDLGTGALKTTISGITSDSLGFTGENSLNATILGLTPEKLGFTGETGLTSTIGSGQTSITKAFETLATNIANANIVQMLVDAAIGRITSYAANIISSFGFGNTVTKETTGKWGG